MVQLAKSTVSQFRLFKIGGMVFPKDQYDVFYENIIIDKNGNVNEKKLKLGLKSRNTGEIIQEAVSVQSYAVGSERYETLQQLLCDLMPLIYSNIFSSCKNSSSGSGSGADGVGMSLLN